MTRTFFRAAALGLGLIAAAPAFAAEMEELNDLSQIEQMDINTAKRPAPSGSTTEIIVNSNTYPDRANFPALSHNKIYAHGKKPRRTRSFRMRRRTR